jgi:glucose-6-phosphate isomerase
MRLADIVTNDPQRLDGCALAVDGFGFNYALQRVTAETVSLLTALAEQQNLAAWRTKMFAGEVVNTTEHRAALHTALRAKTGSIIIDGHDVLPEIRAMHQRMATFTTGVHEGRRTGATDKKFKHVVNIGIGGSDLGPRLAVRALTPYATHVQTHFVANADAFDLTSVIKNLDPAETLFVVVSKTFTTQETLLNAQTARKWVEDKLGSGAAAKHFVAVSTNLKAIKEFGISEDCTFPMWDWVGGRYSLWAAVGLSLMLAIGAENFTAMLDGAATMDAHFLNAPFAKNIPVMMALLGIWNRNFLGVPTLAILPYAERLRRLPRYLQQLDMESNGKSVTRDGTMTDYATAPVIFGDCGTVAQHSFHQWLHQGTDGVAADFIGVCEDDLNQPEHHRMMSMNLAAQATTLAFGREAAKPHEAYQGNRSSSIITLKRMNPHYLGMLLAAYEHKIFTQGLIWNINSFDQPGVELGKIIAHGLENQAIAPAPMNRFAANLLKTLA